MMLPLTPIPLPKIGNGERRAGTETYGETSNAND